MIQKVFLLLLATATISLATTTQKTEPDFFTASRSKSGTIETPSKQDFRINRPKI